MKHLQYRGRRRLLTRLRLLLVFLIAGLLARPAFGETWPTLETFVKRCVLIVKARAKIGEGKEQYCVTETWKSHFSADRFQPQAPEGHFYANRWHGNENPVDGQEIVFFFTRDGLSDEGKILRHATAFPVENGRLMYAKTAEDGEGKEYSLVDFKAAVTKIADAASARGEAPFVAEWHRLPEVVNGLRVDLTSKVMPDGEPKLKVDLTNVSKEPFDIIDSCALFLEVQDRPGHWHTSQHPRWRSDKLGVIGTLEPGKSESESEPVSAFTCLPPGRYVVRVSLTVDKGVTDKYESKRIWTGVARSNSVVVEVPPWGKPVRGVQVRLRVDTGTWNTTEVPVVKVDLRNNGKEEFDLVGYMVTHCYVHIDGVTYAGGCGAGCPPPGRTVEGAKVQLAGSTAMANGFSRVPRSSASGEGDLQWSPGKHVVRVSFHMKPRGAPDNTPLLEVFSNPVEIEIVSGEEAQRGTQPAKTEWEAFVRAARHEMPQAPAGGRISADDLAKPGALGDDLVFSSRTVVEHEDTRRSRLHYEAEGKLLKLSGGDELHVDMWVFDSAGQARDYTLKAAFAGAAPTDFLLASARRHFAKDGMPGEFCFHPGLFVRSNVVVRHSCSKNAALKVSQEIDSRLIAVAQRAARTRSEPMAVKLDATAKMLTQKVGGKWEKRNFSGFGLVLDHDHKKEKHSASYLVMPVPLEEAAAFFARNPYASAIPVRFVGSNKNCTVIEVAQRSDPEFTAGIVEALKLTAARPPADAWGKAVDGLQGRIVFERTRFKQGEPIEPKVLVRNISDKPVPYDLRPVGRDMFAGVSRFEVIGPDGRPVADISASAQTTLDLDGDALAKLKPNGELAVPVNRLDTHHYMRAPGRYRIRWRGLAPWPSESELDKLFSTNSFAEDAGELPDGRPPSLPASATVEIEVVPAAGGGEDGDLVGRVLAVLPPGWKVNGAKLLADDVQPTGRKPDRGSSIGLMHRPDPGSLVNNAAMMLWIMPQPCPEDPDFADDKRAVLLGKGKLGCVYLRTDFDEPLCRWNFAAFDLATALEVNEPKPKKPIGPDWGRMFAGVFRACAQQRDQCESLGGFCDRAEGNTGNKERYAFRYQSNVVIDWDRQPMACTRKDPQQPYYYVRLSIRPMHTGPSDASADNPTITWDGKSNDRRYGIKWLGVAIVMTVLSDDAEFVKAINAILDEEVTRALRRCAPPAAKPIKDLRVSVWTDTRPVNL